MAKQFISIVEISILHDILYEIKTLFSFKIFNFENINDFLNVINNNPDVSNSVIISKNNYRLSEQYSLTHRAKKILNEIKF